MRETVDVDRAARATFPLLTEGESVQFLQRPGGGEIGIDRISMSFPVRSFEPELLPYHNDLLGGDADAPESWSTKLRDHRFPLVSVFVGVMRVAGRMFGKVEGNPSRFVDPDGHGLAPLQALPVVIDGLLRAAEGLGVSRSCDVEHVNVRRQDFARDFRGVAVPSFYVRGLQHIHRPGRVKSKVFADPKRGRAETLWVGNGAGAVRLYDQQEAYAVPGMRWEVQAGRDHLDRAGLARVGDLTVAKMESFAEQRWEWSRMGAEVTGTMNVAEAVERLVVSGELSRARADRVLGQFVRECCGIGSQANYRTERDYEQIKRRLGLVASPDLLVDVPGVEVRGRLDFETGYEVAA